LGWINDKDEMASIFKEHDILLNPSIRYKDWEELFGIVNIEAMASCLAVIASSHIGPKEIITNKVNGFLVNEKIPKDIIDILNQLYKDRKYLKQISQNAIKRANDFSIKNIANQWGKVINE
jgi:glycosyltransferase involved in cell wall biosynthesis